MVQSDGLLKKYLIVFNENFWGGRGPKDPPKSKICSFSNFRKNIKSEGKTTFYLTQSPQFRPGASALNIDPD